ncbi:hypothetical protein SeMB42_g04396 [Synchytrium endobioticum]|uniref:Structural maintenance of chromosomes protein n=1 Tax=Synchytrium endobioticum TaxID=286115 RepID=A0A507DH98_9FUNG|nr:hypothetical protein SeMB42_g04396 [Synchytrium endobioticum]TPX50210.1 hypothetical protein SeLEV6574_g01054 [Synchytrium endobioticum]
MLTHEPPSVPSSPSLPPVPSSGAPSSSSQANGHRQRQTSATARFPSVEPLTIKEEHGPRLVIFKMVLINFKSYAGRIEIGPFHKSFTSIVGPNGSGKSNVIDALLFVFGFKAKKMRQGKLSELIHNSSDFQDLRECGVEVHFQQIKDLPVPDAFEVIPNSALIVSRTADVSSSSTYRVNGRTSSYKEVTNMLKEFGVDLDHKRFLILQGEVESIAQMKPKAQNEHEDGLLEYLEDIIGTAVYKRPIEDASQRLERMNDERAEKLNRVKMVEKDKNALEGKKDEALEFVKMQNVLAKRKNELYQLQIAGQENEMEAHKIAMGELQGRLDAERAKYADLEKEIAELEPLAVAMSAEHEEMRKKAAQSEKELQKIDRAEVELQEKCKHLKDKERKLNKAIKEETFSRNEHETWMNNFQSDMDKQNKELEDLNKRLLREQQELEAIRDSLQDKTAGFKQEIDIKMKELAPWTAKINQAQATLQVAHSEQMMLNDRVNAAATAITDAQNAVSQHRQAVVEKKTAYDRAERNLLEQRRMLTELETLIKDAVKEEDEKRQAFNNSRQKLDDARVMNQSAQSRGAVLAALLQERDRKNLTGICGRLGDLGVIDDRYDVAVTTACGALNDIVVETFQEAQKCLDYLKQTNIGRARFVCLDKLWIKDRDMGPIQTPGNIPRLFDLIKPKDPKYRAVFYKALRDTLVAENLDQANRMASGKQRWRVVTVAGEICEREGVISGGGRPRKGGMGSKFKGDDVSPQQIAALETDQYSHENALKEAVTARKNIEAELEKARREVPAAEMAIPKARMDVEYAQGMIADGERHLKQLQSEGSRVDLADIARIKEVEKIIDQYEKELEKLRNSSSVIEADIKTLQEKILEAGGVRLRSQKAKVDSVQAEIDMVSDRLTKTAAERSTRERNLAKVKKSIEKKGHELAEAAEELARIEEELKIQSSAAVQLRQRVDDAKQELEAKGADLAETKKSLDEKTKVVNKMRSEEVELKAQIDERKVYIKAAQNAINYYNKELNNLKIRETGFEDDDDPEETLDLFTVEQLEKLDIKAIKHECEILEGKINSAKPNLSVLNDYKMRLHDYLARARDLEEFTAQRDQTKAEYDDLRKRRLDEFMKGFNMISQKLKEMYQMITMGGNAELELVDSLDPFSEGILFSVMPPKKSWKNISNLSGGEKTLSSLALVFALHHFKPTPLYVMDEIDAALDFRNVSIVANYIKDRTKNAQFVIISLRNNMFELADRLVGIYKTDNTTKSITINPHKIQIM